MHKAQKILFVINPVAGGRVKTDWEVAIREFFKESPDSVEFYVMSGKSDKTSVQHYIHTIRPGKVVAIGGDGTVKMVAELLKGTSIPLGIIPAGSANGLAKELGIPTEVHEAVKVVLSGRCGQMDAIQINGNELCFHLSDIGLNALLVKYFESSKKRGMWGYARSLFKMFWNKRVMRVTIQTDAGVIKRKAFMVVLANAEKYGTGAVINPSGNVADGVFEIVIVRKINLIEIFKAVTARKSFHPERIEILKAKKAELSFLQKAPFQVDGEYLGKTAFVRARILPRLVHVMLPEANPYWHSFFVGIKKESLWINWSLKEDGTN